MGTPASRQLADRPPAVAQPVPAVALRSKRAAEAVLALQRTVGNQGTGRLLGHLTRGPTPVVTIQRIKANAALSLIAQMVQHAKAVSASNEARELLDIRAAVESIKSEGGKTGGDTQIGAVLDNRLDAVRTLLIQSAPPGENMAERINRTSKDNYNAAMELVNAGHGVASSLAVAMLAAKLNRRAKMDLTIRGGTTRDAVRAAAVADGYRLFAHAAYTQAPDANDAAERIIALDNPAHPNRGEFDEHIKVWLAEHSFTTYDTGNGDIRVYTDDTHTIAKLTRALSAWHPGIASDKTDAGQFREDDPHPNVANQTHNSRPHTHLQAPGCMQTTIVL
jgi:hypothetical protein